jgi:hypothetical protein
MPGIPESLRSKEREIINFLITEDPSGAPPKWEIYKLAITERDVEFTGDCRLFCLTIRGSQ